MTENNSITFYDLVIFSLVVSTLAFRDISFFRLSSQFLAIFVSLLILIMNKYKPNYITNIFLWVSCFSLYCFFSYGWASSVNTTVLSTSISVIQMGCVLLTLLFYINSSERYFKMIDYTIISLMVISLRFFITIPVSEWGLLRYSMVKSFFTSNITAMNIAFLTLILIWQFLFFRCFKLINYKIVILLLCSLSLFIVLVMGSKKGIAIFLLGLTIFYLSRSANIIKTIARVAIVILSIYLFYDFLLNNPLFYQTIGKRIEFMINGFTGDNVTDGSTRARLLFIENAFEVFKSNPIIGVGNDGYRYLNNFEFAYSHNNYTELLANLGIVGFTIYYSVFAGIIKKSIINARKNILPITFLVSMLVADWGMVSYTEESQAIWLCLTIAPLFVPLRKKGEIVFNSN